MLHNFPTFYLNNVHGRKRMKTCKRPRGSFSLLTCACFGIQQMKNTILLQQQPSASRSEFQNSNEKPQTDRKYFPFKFVFK